MDAVDVKFLIAKYLLETIWRKWEILKLTESKKLFDAVTYGKNTMDRWFKVDISGMRKCFRKM